MLRRWKRVWVILGLLLFLASIGGWLAFRWYVIPTTNQLTITNETGQLAMVWAASPDTPKDKYSALLVPVRFSGIEREFLMQFDLGHTSTVFYEEKLRDILERMKQSSPEQLSGTTNTQPLEFDVGNVHVVANKVATRRANTAGIDWSNLEKPELIGTLASDFIEGKILVMDYPANTIQISHKLEELEIENPEWYPFRFRYRRTFLPAIIEGKSTWLMYDTGSSAFDLITDDATFQQLAAPNSAIESTHGNSWGNRISIFHRQSNAKIRLGQTELTCKRVTKMEGMGGLASGMMQMTGMQGMTGNTLFLDHVLVLDYQRQRFGLVSKQSMTVD
jgi:hypothetical protein